MPTNLHRAIQMPIQLPLQPASRRSSAVRRVTMRWAMGAALIAGAAVFTATQAHAGRSCEAQKPPPAKSVERGMQQRGRGIGGGGGFVHAGVFSRDGSLLCYEG